MNHFQPPDPGASRRASIAIIGLMTLFGVLLVAFFRLQVLESDAYALRSESNRLRPIPIEAPRGAVFDRNGRVVASSGPGYSLHVSPPAASRVTEETLERLRSYLDLDDERIELLLEDARREPYQPLLVDGDADFRPRLHAPRSIARNCPTWWFAWFPSAAMKPRARCLI